MSQNDLTPAAWPCLCDNCMSSAVVISHYHGPKAAQPVCLLRWSQLSRPGGFPQFFSFELWNSNMLSAVTLRMTIGGAGTVLSASALVQSSGQIVKIPPEQVSGVLLDLARTKTTNMVKPGVQWLINEYKQWGKGAGR